jgi:hypothetical protein
LSAHARSTGAGLGRLDARVICVRGELVCEFQCEGELARIRWPEPAAPHRAGRLWEHTCFEAFVTDTRGTAYRELNASPSGGWAVYHFDSYRSGMRPVDLSRAPTIACARTAGRATLRVSVALDALTPGHGVPEPSSLRLALSAVIEDDTGAFAWFALRHPGAQPDFHHGDSFVMALGSGGAGELA